LIGTAARTAVIAGTATAVAGSVSSAQQQRAAARQATVQQQAAPAGSLTDDKLTQLQKLADLQKTGVLSEQEFENLKAKILAG
jgi:hypothetical protein